MLAKCVQVLACSDSLAFCIFLVLTARKKILTADRARKNKRAARVLANVREDLSISLR